MRHLTRILLGAGVVLLIGSFALPLNAQRGKQKQQTTQPQTKAEATDGPTVVNGFDLSRLQFRYVGPPGNRVSAVVSPPGNKDVYFAGAASGGVWKSTDAGKSWRPVFDKMKAQSIGAMDIAPSNHQIVWVGTGESWVRSGISLGDGVYKSEDGGESWKHMGLDQSGRVSRVIVHPKDPNIVYIGALGHCYGPQKERGVYRTKDGGKTWEQVLFVNENTGVAEITMDPTNPNVLFASTWEVTIYTWGKYSGGPGSGVFKSTDGGTTWKRLTPAQGLPESPLGKIAVSIAPSNPKRVYALIETGWNGKGTLWRSDDGGEQWRVMNYAHIMAERPHYYTRMLICPTNPDEVYFPNNQMSATMDGGKSVRTVPGWGGDNHDMWADPTDADRMMIGNDGGVMITTDHGRNWNRVVLPIAQMYHVAVDNAVPYGLHGSEQDRSSVRGPAASLGGSIQWGRSAGCESGFAIPDPVDPNIIWGTCYGGGVERYDVRTGLARSVDVWPEKSLDSPAKDTPYRWNWTHVVYISPHDHNTVYVGSQYLHRTTNGGQSWEIISPDLTTDDKSKQGPSGGLTHDNLGVEYGCTIFAVAECPLEKGVIWVGSNDGIVSVTRDGGKTWAKDLCKDAPNFLKWGTVSNIQPSRYAKGTAYISVDGHQVNNRDPLIFKTSDYGKTWKCISTTIPKSVFSYVHCVREDPKRQGLLYAGTENGLYVSFDDGEHWQSLQLNLPHVGISWIEIQENYNDLVIGTSGRGFYILDDLTPVQQASAAVAESTAKLFPPRQAYRLVSRSPGFNPGGGGPGGGRGGRGGGAAATLDSSGTVIKSMAPGAYMQYYLKEAGPVTFEIANSDGRHVRTLRANGVAGLNNVSWDLRYGESVRPVELRTTPSTYPQIWDEPRFQGQTTRPIVHYGIGPPQQPLRAAPGTYKVEMTAGSAKSTENLKVLADPNVPATEQDIQESVKLGLSLTDEVNLVVDNINRIERMRKQLEDLYKQRGSDSSTAQAIAAAKAVDEKLMAVEDELLQKMLQENNPKAYQAPMKLYLLYLHLLGQVGNGAGDMAGNPGFKPTDQTHEVHKILKKRLDTQLALLKNVIDNDVAAFNKSAGPQVGVILKP